MLDIYKVTDYKGYNILYNEKDETFLVEGFTGREYGVAGIKRKIDLMIANNIFEPFEGLDMDGKEIRVTGIAFNQFVTPGTMTGFSRTIYTNTRESKKLLTKRNKLVSEIVAINKLLKDHEIEKVVTGTDMQAYIEDPMYNPMKGGI